MSEVIKVSVLLSQPVPVVWKAITNHKKMVRWFFENIPEFQPKVGFRTSFDVKSNSRTFKHNWLIKEVVPEKWIQYNWTYEAIDGVGTVVFQIEAESNKTRITVINEGIESFPKEIPEFHPESCREGWEYFIKDRLQNYLNSLDQKLKK